MGRVKGFMESGVPKTDLTVKPEAYAVEAGRISHEATQRANNTEEISTHAPA